MDDNLRRPKAAVGVLALLALPASIAAHPRRWRLPTSAGNTKDDQ